MTHERSEGPAPALIAAVTVKLPPLSIKNPGVWFRRAEAKFRLSGIKNGVTMADHTLSAMSEETADLIQAWLTEQPEQLEYEDLKAYILKRFSLSETDRAQRVLSLAQQPLGDSTARDRWEEIQSLLILPAGKNGPPKTVSLEREIFLQSLPDAVRQSLPDAHTMETRDLIAQADKLLDAHKATLRRASTFEVSPQVGDICSATPAAKKRSALSTDPEAPTLCFYHSRYGDEAKKCRPHCPRWSKNGRVGRQ
jgi:hypothetical protein